MAKENEKNLELEIATGLETASDKKEAEYDLVASLLEAASYREDKDLLNKTQIT